ncbi:hypothetical protein F5Y05DRAFT_422806 [Hypoxylon sp. FL0543]|nr:hypothetical protein F5Y05DRAFT_422806 [Hypoxylon sp. FL0543]
MALKKRGSGSKKDTPKKPTRARTGVPDSGYETDPNGQPAKAAIGVVLNNGLFECRVLGKNGRCGARMKNAVPNIRSHHSKKHAGDHSAYLKGQARGSNWPCTLGCKTSFHQNFHSLLAHARTSHGFTGESQPLRENSMKLRERLRQQSRKARGEESSGDDDDDDDDGYDEDNYDDDDYDDDDDSDGHPDNDHQDPPGASGSLPIGAAA